MVSSNFNNILITGGAGYIGSILCLNLIKAGYNIRVLDNLTYGGSSLLAYFGNQQFKFIYGDVRDNDALAKSLQNIDIVIHLAAIVGDPACSKSPKDVLDINLKATKNLINLSKKKGIKRFIFFSTCSNYGISDPNKLSKETSPLNPISLYAETKVESEKYILDNEGNGFLPCILRFSTVFGASSRMRFDLTVNQFTLDAILNKKLIVFAPNLWRPYIHIRDVANVINLIIEAPKEKVKGQIYNIGSNLLSYKKIDIANLIQKNIKGIEIEIVDKGKDLRDYRVSFDKLKNTFSFTPLKSVEDGIKEIKNLLESGIISNPLDDKYYNHKSRDL